MSDMPATPPVQDPPVKRMRGVMWSLVLLAGVAVLLVLHYFPPGQYPIYPVCPLRQHTGLDCPGCGGLRAMHQLTNGNVAAAWRLNPFVFVLVPLVAYEIFVRTFWKRPHASLLGRPKMLLILGILMLAFSVVRNLPKFAQWFS